MRLFKEVCILSCLLVTTMLLGGCVVKRTLGESETKDKDFAQSTLNYEFLEEQDLAWKDNSLDEWQAVFNLPIEEIKAEGELFEGRLRYLVGENGAVRFKTHTFSGGKKDWSGVNGITSLGEKFSGKVIVDDEYIGLQIDELGPAAGGNGYIACRYDIDSEKELVGYHYFFLNNKFEKLREIEGKKISDEYMNAIAVDDAGNIHILFSIEKYIVLSPEGDTIFETSKSLNRATLCTLADGRVVVVEDDVSSSHALTGWKIYEVDIERGVISSIATVSRKKFNDQQFPPFLTMSRETELVVCDSEGVYLYNLQESKQRLVYKWSKHGLSMKDIISVYAKPDGTIGVIYKDKEGMQYILLKPRFEERTIKHIEFAVSPKHLDTYREAVATFNKKYPTYVIDLKDDYEETPLLTKLGSGEGPVLVDTELTGFDALQKLWQPLDGYLENTGLVEELYPQALGFGQIGDISYGIVPTFGIETLITKDHSLFGWDYNGFLDAVENFGGSVFAWPYIFEPGDHRELFLYSLSNGLEDNVYFDTEKGNVIFGTSAFRRILTLAEKANPCLPVENGKTLVEGRVLCEILYVNNVRDIMRLRMRLESEDIVNVGYPTKNGGKNMLVADSPIAIRATATDEEKQIAYTFFKILLSHESAMVFATDNYVLYHSHFSIRKDILEEQFDQHNRVHEYNDDPEIDKKKERELFERLLENAVVKKTFPADLQSVFDEEFAEYLKGVIPTDLLDSRLRSRVGLYLDEK